MERYWIAAAAVLIAVIMSLSLGKHAKETALLLTLAVCCMVASLAVDFLAPVIGFIHRLQSVGQLDTELLSILLKAAGIGLVGELAGLICSDAGNAALGKSMQFLSAAVILWLSLPLLEQLLTLVSEILGEV